MANLLLNNLALELLYQGRFREAEEVIEGCIEHQRRTGARELGESLDTLAHTYALLGDPDRARDCWLEVALLAAPDDEPMQAAIVLEGMAFAAGLRHRADTAIRLHATAVRLFNQAGARGYFEPLAPNLAELMERLASEVGPEDHARLVKEGAELSPREAFDLFEIEG